MVWEKTASLISSLHYFQASTAIHQGFLTLSDKLLLEENTVRIENS